MIEKKHAPQETAQNSLFDETGRLNIQCLKDNLKFPSDRWILDTGGGRISAYLWFPVPDQYPFEARNLNDLYAEKVGKSSIKYSLETDRRNVFYGKKITENENWFCIEIHPEASEDIPKVQAFIDEVDRRIKVETQRMAGPSAASGMVGGLTAIKPEDPLWREKPQQPNANAERAEEGRLNVWRRLKQLFGG